MTSNDLHLSATAKAISYPRFAAFYNRMMKQPQIRQQFDPLRREIVGQAHGVVLEVGAGGGQNFPFYDRSRVVRVEAIEPDETMLVYAEGNQGDAPVPIQLSRAAVEMLPFPEAHFDSVVVTLVLCSVHDPERSLHEIRRVLSPGGRSLALGTCPITSPRDTQRVSPIGPFHSERHLPILSEAEKSLLRIRGGTKRCAPPIQRQTISSAEI